MRFSIEQIFLTDGSGRPLDGSLSTAYHLVEADTVDGALSSFLSEQQANVIGMVQRFPGAQAIATAQQQETVFTCRIEPGTDMFRRRPPRASTGATNGRPGLEGVR